MNGDYTRWGVLEERSSSLFLVAGAVLVVYGAANGIVTFTDVAVQTTVLWFGYIFSFLGLLGLYPTLAGEHPWLARVGAGAAAVGLVGVTVVSLLSVGHLAGFVPPWPIPGLVSIYVMALVGFIGGYLTFGLAALRSDAHSTAVGLAIAVPGVIIVLMVLHLVAGLEQPESVFVISSGQAMAHLAIGETLRRQSARPESDETADGSTEEATPSVATDD